MLAKNASAESMRSTVVSFAPLPCDDEAASRKVAFRLHAIFSPRGPRL
jgi:hypothetical protein